MSKKKALGDDPLSWIKDITNAEKPENNVNDKEEDANVPIEPKIDNAVNTEQQEQKVQEVQEVQKEQEKGVYQSSDVTERYRKMVLKENAASQPAQKESPATIFVIVYTVLLVILGFLVYRDMSKRINNLETKLTNIEKKVESSYETYENTKVDDVW